MPTHSLANLDLEVRELFLATRREAEGEEPGAKPTAINSDDSWCPADPASGSSWSEQGSVAWGQWSAAQGRQRFLQSKATPVGAWEQCGTMMPEGPVGIAASLRPPEWS
ncbi:hypothetical protein NDU88_002708 [Pleurodeles waltl]|uniref:Uncharacterized protein n=1 Tax=Pleurodeles waltl TaxID=8319 RepID=A0AAV7RAS5_PLEWA|nr:hypothetical protein NDU88_002708 [Pleurodeles waltl]